MKATKIKGYSVEISVCDDATQCWVEKGKFSSSLAVLSDTGFLENFLGATHKVKPDTIDEINEWAEAQGY